MLRISKIGPLFVFCFFLLFSPAIAAENPQSYQITVSAAIGEPKLTVFGYTSPQALVELGGQRVAEDVIANEMGYFYFNRVFLPQPKLARHPGGVFVFHPQGAQEMVYPEICLTSVDTQSQISSFPTCLPPLPTGPFEITVGPVLLPPTLSLAKGNFLPNEQVITRGSTIPNSEVTIFLANEETPRGIIYAYSLPKYQIRSDETGHFEFNLPVSKAKWKIFAATTYFDSPSPKSNTLVFQVLSWWAWFWLKIKEILLAIFHSVGPHWWWLVVGGEICLITFLILHFFGKLSFYKKS